MEGVPEPVLAELKNYITGARRVGQSDETIQETLRTAGWSDEQVSFGFLSLLNQEQEILPDVPNPIIPKSSASVKRRTHTTWTWAIVSFLLMTIALGSIWYGFVRISNSGARFSADSQTATSTTATTTGAAATTTIELAHIEWKPIQRLPDLHLFATSTDQYPVYASTSERYFKVGIITSPQLYANCDLIVAEVQAVNTDMDGPAAGYFADCANHYTLLERANTSYQPVYSGLFKADGTINIDKMTQAMTLGAHPTELFWRDATLRLVGSDLVDYTSSTSTDLETFAIKQWQPAFTLNGQSFYTDGHGNYYLLAPDRFRFWQYQLQISFITATSTIAENEQADIAPQILLNDGSVMNSSTTIVRYTAYSGTGLPQHYCPHGLITASTSIARDELVPAGHAVVTNEPIYTLSSTSLLMHRLYEDYATITAQFNSYRGTADPAVQVVPYNIYLEYHPALFWIDPFGTVDEMLRSDLVPTDCGKGKPVIYLYPPQTEPVSVQIDPQGGLSTSSPLYGKTGWHVDAKPDGQLTDVATGRSYPYLFWEAPGWPYTDPKQGFVVADGNVKPFLIKTLTELGLNAQEQADFEAFWVPRLHGAPYYFISFFGNRVMNEQAPLTITPTPDTLIRIFMYYRPLTTPISVPPQHFTTPKRTGFTVVEWGGVL